MKFCINCKHYSAYEAQRDTVHNCGREVSKNFNMVTGQPLPGYFKNAETERAGDSSIGYCGPTGIHYERKF